MTIRRILYYLGRFTVFWRGSVWFEVFPLPPDVEPMKYIVVIVIIILIIAGGIGFYNSQVDEPIVSEGHVTVKVKEGAGGGKGNSNQSHQSSSAPDIADEAKIADIEKKIRQAVDRTPLPPGQEFIDQDIELIPMGGEIVDVDKTFPLKNASTSSSLLNSLSTLPSSIVPKKVTAKEPLILHAQMNGENIGTVTIRTGQDAEVKEIKGEELLISAGIASADIPISKTDFAERLEAAYNKGVSDENVGITQKREAAEANNKRLIELRRQYAATVGKPPEKRPDGIIPAVLHGLLLQGAPVISPKDIAAYGDVKFQVIDNEPYWVSTLQLSPDYKPAIKRTVATLFGERREYDDHQPLTALIRHGKVVQWVRIDE